MHDFQDFLFLIREDIDLRGGGSKEVKRCRTNIEYIFPPEGLDRGANLRYTAAELRCELTVSEQNSTEEVRRELSLN